MSRCSSSKCAEGLLTTGSSFNPVASETAQAVVERSDVTAVPAMGVIAEAMLALVMADAMLEKFGGDSLAEMRRNYDAYLAHVAQRLR